MQRPRRRLLRLAMLVAAVGGSTALAACGQDVIRNSFPEDLDGDGWAAPEDCDDEDAARHPGAVELCDDGIDNDCNGLGDGDDAVCTEDADGDGYVIAKDCDDGDPAVHPGAEEVCDGQDNDCDGLLDGLAVAYDVCATPDDQDGDGYPAVNDCDDLDADVNPGAWEQCDDGKDNDCDGLLDWDDADACLIGNG